MNQKGLQDYFRVLDAADADTLASDYFHPDMLVFALGVEGIDRPLSCIEFLDMQRAILGFRATRKETVTHIPAYIKVQGDLAFVDGALKVTYPGSADVYGKFTDFFKFKDGKILEYNICSHQMEGDVSNSDEFVAGWKETE